MTLRPKDVYRVEMTENLSEDAISSISAARVFRTSFTFHIFFPDISKEFKEAETIEHYEQFDVVRFVRR